MFSGYLSIFITLLLWSGFFLSLKSGANSTLTLADIALTRFLLPAALLLPLVIKARKQIANVPIKYLFAMFIGSGLPYLLIAGYAMQSAPVSDGSALIPGTLPLFVSAIAVLLFQQPLSQHRKIGLIIVCVGIGLFLTNSFSLGKTAQFTGHLLFLVASFMWASFTISARVANLHPFVTAGFISFSSSITLLVLIMSGTLNSSLAASPLQFWPWQELIGHVFVQGIGAGLFATFTYLYSINKLGAERSAAFAATTPVVATLLAIVVFSEIPSTLTWVALSLICTGSIIASNVFLKNDASLAYQPPNRH